MNEKKFVECLLEEATHIEVNGVRHELNDNVLYFRNGDLLGISWRDEYTYISEELFSTLGIKPLKEKKREPIEFVGFTKYVSRTLSHIINVPLGTPPQTRFKCVEILEDEE